MDAKASPSSLETAQVSRVFNLRTQQPGDSRREEIMKVSYERDIPATRSESATRYRIGWTATYGSDEYRCQINGI